MIPLSAEIKEESSNFEPVKYISSDKVKYGTDDTLLTLSYRDTIDTIQQVKKTYNDILTRGFNTYVKHMMENFRKNFDFDPSNQHSVIPRDYKPEIYTTE